MDKDFGQFLLSSLISVSKTIKGLENAFEGALNDPVGPKMGLKWPKLAKRFSGQKWVVPRPLAHGVLLGENCSTRVRNTFGTPLEQG